MPALDKVCKVKDRPEAVPAELVHQQAATLRAVAVDVLFVLVEQDHLLGFGVVHKSAQTLKHLVPVVVGPAPLGDEKAEHADVAGVQNVGQLHHVFEVLKMAGKLLGNLDLPDGGGQGGHADSAAVKAPPDLPRLRLGVGVDPPLVHAANLHVAHAQTV